MLLINIIYQNKNMPADILPKIDDSGGAYEVVWSKKLQPNADVVVYFNEYTYDEKKHRRTCPEALKVLYMYEPVSVDPMQYTARVWKQFDAVLTWNTYLTESSAAFTFEAGAYFDLPYSADYGVTPLQDLPDPATREKAVCQICGDKYSLSAEEIYSERRRIARWFNDKAVTRMDVYGKPAMKVPNYRGVCENKSATFAKYRYALCFENTYHPQWTRGYLTEKILDCMASSTVPIYYGCSNIEELVPADCFIDYREFASLDQLDEFLQTMTDEAYLGYVGRMRDFLASYNAPQRHSVYRLYETVVELMTGLEKKKAPSFPRDYRAMCSFMGRCRFNLMRLLLPHHRIIYPVFAMVRSAGSVFKVWKK